jgi:hypothetical protein
MNRYKYLEDQLRKAIENYEKAIELESLIKKHKEINSELKDKANVALQKDQNGQIVTDSEQEAIDDLAKQQEEVFGRITNKVLNK